MNKKLLIAIILTSVVFLAFIGVMLKMITENNECVDSPFIYSAKKLRESGGNYLCSCRSLDPNLLDFTFNEEGIEIKKPIDIKDLNITNITGVN